jgi:hypothetical protein
MKIRCSSLFFGSFAPHFQIKLSIHASNFNSKFVSMNELELFLLTGVLIPNFNTMDLIFNKDSPQAHTELELGVLGVHRKLVKYVVHSSKRKN